MPLLSLLIVRLICYLNIFIGIVLLVIILVKFKDYYRNLSKVESLSKKIASSIELSYRRQDPEVVKKCLNYDQIDYGFLV